MVSNCAATVTFIDVLSTLVRPVHELFILCIFQHDLWDFPHVLQADIICRTLLTLMLALILAVCIIKSSISPDGELQLLGISLFCCCCLSCTPTNFLTTWIDRLNVSVPHRGQHLIIIHSLAFGGRGCFACRTNIPCELSFDSTLGFPGEGPNVASPLARKLEYFQRLKTLLKLYELAEQLPKDRKRKRRTRKSKLPYHKRRKRVDWHQWVRELGPDDFYTHHRMTRATFEKLLRIIGDRLQTDHRKVRYGTGPVTPRIQLTMCLKFLGGDSTHDIKKHMGGLCILCSHKSCNKFQKYCVAVARSTVSKYNLRVMQAIVAKMDIPPFPLDDDERLEELAQGFREKSCGQLFRFVFFFKFLLHNVNNPQHCVLTHGNSSNVIGAFDGYLLHVSKKCLHKEVNSSKFWCRCVARVRVVIKKIS